MVFVRDWLESRYEQMIIETILEMTALLLEKISKPVTG
jgi:hypothetical protein